MPTDPRLINDRNIWLATTRPDGRPHLVPIWFVWLRDKCFVCTEAKSVKARNLIANGRASFALEDGNRPLIGEGTATLLERPFPPDVVAEFKAKYDWDINAESGYSALIEIAPAKWLTWKTA